VYVSYTDIFKPQSARDRDGKYLEPVVGKNYETGWKGEFYGRRLNSGVSLYLVRARQRRRARWRRQGAGHSRPGRRLPRRQRRQDQGIDMELAGELAAGWNVQAGYSHSRTEDADSQRLTTQLPMDTFRLWNTCSATGRLAAPDLGQQGQVELQQLGVFLPLPIPASPRTTTPWSA
jgi:outer membrane receptor for ferric coprogen and ferric-rhodotorulic acid